MSVTASDINAAIKAKYSGEQWRVWFEVSQSTGAYSGRRADAVVMNIWPSKDFQLHVFEVKVSRSDFKNEVADLTKWQAIGKHADFFWLSCPKGLVDVAEVPQEWGLMEFDKSGLRIKKQAQVRVAEPLTRGFAASLLRAGRDLTEEHIERLANERSETQIKRVQESERERFDRLIANARLKADKLEEWKAAFEAKFGVRPNIHLSPERMADRLNLAAALDTGNFQQIANQARGLAKLIDKVTT